MKLVPEGITRSISRQVLQTKKNSPHIFFAAGVVGMIGSTFLACRATLKLEPVIDSIEDDLKQVKEMGRPSESGGDVQRYPDREYYRDLGYVYARSAKKIGRLYGPSIVLGVASVGALTGSHVQLTRRNSALTATLALVSQAYDDYRDRVREELGEERELNIYRGMGEEKIDIDGKKQLVQVTDPTKWSPYARFFDETNVNWVKDPESNRMFLHCQQNYSNHLLNARGHLFLNEVYDMLGMERSKAGQVVGWVLNGDGDEHVDFGIFEAYNNRFVNNLERSIILDFNVDGPIYAKAFPEDY